MIARECVTVLTTICVIVISILTVQSPSKPSPGDVYRTASPSVVLIETYGDDGKAVAAGTGFLVSADGAILTNYHVLQHAKRATVRLANGAEYNDVGLIDIDKRKDIALIKIKAVNLPFLKLGHSDSAQIGDTLYTLGNPLGVFQNTFSEGILSGIRQVDDYRLLQLSAPISHGSSGSPVFNGNGDVVAIVEATISEGQSLNFAIPIDYAAGMLGSTGIHSLASIYEPEPDNASPGTAPATAKNQDRETLEYLKQLISSGLVVELRPDDAADLLNKALADKKPKVFEFLVVSQKQGNIMLGIHCSMLHVCGQTDRAGWMYQGNLWIEASCEVGCDSQRLPPEQVWCNVTLERKHNRTFELYIAIPERAGGKAQLSWWKLTSMWTVLPTKPK